MNVTQLLQRLSYGPLSNLSMANNGDGTIVDAKKPVLISYANEALHKLYAKFNLKEAELIIEQDNTVTAYKIDSKYSLENAAANPTLKHYIIDSPAKPFTDDFIRILRIVNEAGFDVPLNDDNRIDSLFTPTVDVLQVPDPEDGRPLFVVYQAKHAILSGDVEGAGFATQAIELPQCLEEALLSYVAHKVYFYMNGQENAVKSSDYLSLFTNSCNEVTEQDLVMTSLSSTSQKFHDRGFR